MADILFSRNTLTGLVYMCLITSISNGNGFCYITLKNTNYSCFLLHDAVTNVSKLPQT